jgi:hypothetical protein
LVIATCRCCLSLLLLPYEFVPFDEALQLLYGLVEELKIPEE